MSKEKEMDIFFILESVPKEINLKNARDSSPISRHESCDVTSFAMQLPVSSICWKKKQKKKRKKIARILAKLAREKSSLLLFAIYIAISQLFD